MKLGKIVKVTAIVTKVAVGSAEMAQAYSWGTFGGGNSWTTWGNRTFGSDGSSMTTWGNPVQSWDCIAGSCIDPGTGLGMYSDEATCLSFCGISAINNINLSKENNKFTDILGREWKCSFIELPKGIYITNNKKVLKTD